MITHFKFTDDRPTREEMCMAVAHLMSFRGTCNRKKVGVAIAREGRILSTGYNSAPAGMPHCNHECDCDFAYGSHASTCSVEGICDVTIHAELNAIVWAARHGISLQGGDLFTTYAPCLNCAKAVINAGIKKFYYIEPYHKTEGLDLIVEAGLEVFDFTKKDMIW
ncbi:MAG: deoxycytidylate deaminase [Pyrinomonadaceae bacterium]